MRTWRAKWIADGATSLAEIADKLREEADYIESLDNDGWKLEDVVEDDYAHLVKETEMCDCYVCQNYEVVEIADCPQCDFVNAPLTEEGICLNCTLASEAS